MSTTTTTTNAMNNEMENGMSEKTMTVAAAKKKHTAAREAVGVAQDALTTAQDGLDAAMLLRSALDQELDTAPDMDAADIAPRIATNAAEVEALRRLRDRRAEALGEVQEAAETARQGVSAAELLELADDLAGFDVDAEKARLLALVQDEYTKVLSRLYGFDERVRRARGLVGDAAKVGVQASVTGMGGSADVIVDGRTLRTPVPVSLVRGWFDGLRDEQLEAWQAEGREDARRRRDEANVIRHEYDRARRDALPDAPATTR